MDDDDGGDYVDALQHHEEEEERVRSPMGYSSLGGRGEDGAAGSSSPSWGVQARRAVRRFRDPRMTRSMSNIPNPATHFDHRYYSLPSLD